MSATIGAALKKIAVALATDRRNWEKIGIALLAVLLLFLLPVLSVEAVFQGDFDWDSPELVSAVMEDLDIGSLGFLETSDSVLIQLQDALKDAGFGFDEFRKAQALYWLALSPYGEEPDFVEKLVGLSLIHICPCHFVCLPAVYLDCPTVHLGCSRNVRKSG